MVTELDSCTYDGLINFSLINFLVQHFAHFAILI